MVQEIQDSAGLPNFTSAVHYAIAMAHKKVEPAYLNIGKSRMTPEERGQFSIDVKLAKDKHKANLKFQEKSKICTEVLGGEVFKDGTGGHSCRYFVYDMENDEPQVLPLDLVNEGYHEHQFFPGKEEVLKARPVLKEKFNK